MFTKLDGYVGSNGYEQPKNPNWWYDISFKNSFNIFDLNNFYPNDYFDGKEPFPVNHLIDRYYYRVLEAYHNIYKKQPISILECGTSSGWFTKKFQDEHIDIIGIEGTDAGINKCIANGVKKDNLIKHDLRRIINLNKKFDIVLCTEVAEHIEPPFSASLIYNLTIHSDFIWFSSVEPNTNSPHYHHPNEQPNKFWINLFKFYGFDYISIPKEISSELYGRGTHIFIKH